jgi:hypothetical protein
MATRMQQRRGTASQWTTANPILAPGEIGFESDTGQFKIGDGTNYWADLSYFKNIDDLGGNLDDYVLLEEVGQSIAQLVDGKVPASQLNLTAYATTSAVTTAVNNAVSGLVDGAPNLLNTLNELAAAINDDEEFSVTVLDALASKVDDTQLETLIEDTIIPLDSRVGTLEQLKQDKVTGVSDSEIGTLSDINTATTIQSQLNLKAAASDLDNKANVSHNHSTTDITGLSASASELNILDGATLTTTELNYVDGVTSAIQTQLNSKASSSHTHVLADVTDVTATPSELNILDGATVSTAELNILDGATLSTTELNYLDGVTSAVQTQLNGKAASSHTHSLADVTDVTATASEVNSLSGVDSNVQDQIDGKAASSHTHTISAITDITVDAAAINSLDGVQGNVQDQLDDKSDVDHTHTLSDVVDVTASFTEVNYLVGTTSSVQNQLNAKQDDITGAASTVVSTDLSASKAVISNASGKIDVSSVTAAELGHVAGVTSGIQSQINGKSATGHTHTVGDLTGVNATTAELNRLVGVSADIQGQLDGKAASSHTHVISDVTNLQDSLDSKLALSGGTLTGALTLSGAPTQANHAATKAYADSIAEGLHIHPSCVAATAANVNISTGLEPGDVVDGVTLAEGHRVLVKSQTNSAQNGIYVVQASGAALRASDFNEPAEVDGGDFVFVTGGTLYDNTGWVQTTTNVVTVGTDPIVFTQFSGAGTITAGTNISVNGAEVSTVSDPSFTSVTVSSGLTLQEGAAVSGLALGNGALDDVTISAPASADVVFFNGTGWVNRYLNAIPTKISSATVSSNNYELVATDAGKIVEISNASATTVTIPSDETFAVGTMIVVSQTGTGQITVVVENSGTQTLNSTPGSKLRAQWSVATLLKRSANTWLVYGDLVA